MCLALGPAGGGDVVAEGGEGVLPPLEEGVPEQLGGGGSPVRVHLEAAVEEGAQVRGGPQGVLENR